MVQCGKLIQGGGDLVFTWNVYKDIQLVYDVVSSSVDPRIFKISPYTLHANATYTFQVMVYLKGNTKLSSSATVTVSVGVSGVVAVIAGNIYII